MLDSNQMDSANSPNLAWNKYDSDGWGMGNKIPVEQLYLPDAVITNGAEKPMDWDRSIGWDSASFNISNQSWNKIENHLQYLTYSDSDINMIKLHWERING